MFDFSTASAADALAVIRRLQSAGFVAYLAGGCVRDGLLGRPPKDFDVATNATPEAVRQIFGHRRTLAFGASFGVIGVQGTGKEPTEVATFRSDGTYSDGRRPDQVHFGSAEEDALRRDYTINGLFYDPVQDSVIDFVDGRADLAKRVVRAIGDPYLRIAEDKLRMLRAVRFAATLGFSIDHVTTDAIRRLADQVIVTSGERIGAEVQRMLGNRGAQIAIELLADTHLLEVIWPGICNDLLQLDLAVRLAGAVQPPDFAACVAGIVASNAPRPIDMVDQLSTLWKLSCDQRDAIEQAVRHRDVILAADSRPWSVVQPLLMLKHRDTILAAAQAWALAGQFSVAGIDFCRNRIASWPADQLDPTPLLTGQDLIARGYKPGPAFKPLLAAVRAAQLDGEIRTQAEAIKLVEQTIVEP
ncbi:MAG TPA: [cytidine(C)-cytidine(C)-adenosine (A)]-adding enzyme [Planctomycetaceae bacterium]|nr:[cytidine(C)-cytidine(C)-adenosine (A)]-adding enzyme [Planctomycetaceae bacterium]